MLPARPRPAPAHSCSRLAYPVRRFCVWFDSNPPLMSTSLSWRLRCSAAAPDALPGDRMQLPPSCLQALEGRMRPGQPVLLRLSKIVNAAKPDLEIEVSGAEAEAAAPRPAHTAVYGGIRDFSAAEGTAVVPQWMLQALHIEAGSGSSSSGPLLHLRVCDDDHALPKAGFAALRPVGAAAAMFGSLPDPRAVLESALARDFATLTKVGRLSAILAMAGESAAAWRHAAEMGAVRCRSVCSVVAMRSCWKANVCQQARPDARLGALK